MEKVMETTVYHRGNSGVRVWNIGIKYIFRYM